MWTVFWGLVKRICVWGRVWRVGGRVWVIEKRMGWGIGKSMGRGVLVRLVMVGAVEEVGEMGICLVPFWAQCALSVSARPSTLAHRFH